MYTADTFTVLTVVILHRTEAAKTVIGGKLRHSGSLSFSAVGRHRYVMFLTRR